MRSTVALAPVVEAKAEASASGKPRLLVLSHVMPFPRDAGQQQRVYYTLVAARRQFHVTFLGIASERPAQSASDRRELHMLCDEVILLPTRRASTGVGRVGQLVAGGSYLARTGLKSSNYVIGQLEFTPARIDALLRTRHFDCVLFEYWHAVDSIAAFHRHKVRCVLDMHDILWHSVQRQLAGRRWPAAITSWALRRYREREEQAWSRFDALVAINREEQRYVASTVTRAPLFHAPMGTDLERWPFSWAPSRPPRLAYYGSLSSAHNQDSALRCVEQIMPQVWQTRPDVEFWVVGSKPPERIQRLASDPRVRVTGFVPEPQALLSTMTAVLCPWSGQYGFRSRLIEVMALGVPTIVSPDAIWGMDLEAGKGVLVAEDDRGFAAHAATLLEHPEVLQGHSRSAREQVVHGFSVESTYDRLVDELAAWVGTEAGHR